MLLRELRRVRKLLERENAWGDLDAEQAEEVVDELEEALEDDS